MNIKEFIFIAFILMVLFQLFIPAQMIVQRENVLRRGTAYKFKTAPIDPSDPFRGKYIDLSFEATRFYTDIEAWRGKQGETVFVHLSTDSAGFARIQQISLLEPATEVDYLKAEIRYVFKGDEAEASHIRISYPFDRFYMEESKAYEAEQVYRESRRAGEQLTYALVRIKGGEAVIENVLIDGTPIQELVKLRQAESH